MDAMGSPDLRQIGGMAGATSHTSKVVVMFQSKMIAAEYVHFMWA
jgi:2-methylaconitate cis-trans-isomerase PrpF